jgi:LPXTG-motif cell wall-anchored protein
VTRVTAADADADAAVAEAEPADDRPAQAMAQNDAAQRPADAGMDMNRPSAAARTALPQTASERGWIAAAGFFSVIAGLVLMARRRTA